MQSHTQNFLDQNALAGRIRAMQQRHARLMHFSAGGLIFAAQVQQRHRWPSRPATMKWEIDVEFNDENQKLLLCIIEEESFANTPGHHGLAWSYSPEEGTLTDLLDDQGVVAKFKPIKSSVGGVFTCLFEAWIGAGLIIPRLTIASEKRQLPAQAMSENASLIFITGASIDRQGIPNFENVRFAIEPTEQRPMKDQIILPINRPQEKVRQNLESLSLEAGSIHQPLVPDEVTVKIANSLSRPTGLVNIDKHRIKEAQPDSTRNPSVLWEEPSNPFVDMLGDLDPPSTNK
jgi:hypothetical protein